MGLGVIAVYRHVEGHRKGPDEGQDRGSESGGPAQAVSLSSRAVGTYLEPEIALLTRPQPPHAQSLAVIHHETVLSPDRGVGRVRSDAQVAELVALQVGLLQLDDPCPGLGVKGEFDGGGVRGYA